MRRPWPTGECHAKNKQKTHYKSIQCGRKILPLITKFGTRWRRDIRFTPTSILFPGNTTKYQLNRRFCGPHSRSGQCGEQNNLYGRSGNRITISSFFSPQIILQYLLRNAEIYVPDSAPSSPRIN
jgi:hypothetical protein